MECACVWFSSKDVCKWSTINWKFKYSRCWFNHWACIHLHRLALTCMMHLKGQKHIIALCQLWQWDLVIKQLLETWQIIMENNLNFAWNFATRLRFEASGLCWENRLLCQWREVGVLGLQWRRLVLHLAYAGYTFPSLKDLAYSCVVLAWLALALHIYIFLVPLPRRKCKFLLDFVSLNAWHV